LTFSIKGIVEEQAGKFVCDLSKALNGIASAFQWLNGSNKWQLDSKTEKDSSNRCLLVEVP